MRYCCQPISPLAYPAHLHLYSLHFDSAQQRTVAAAVTASRVVSRVVGCMSSRRSDLHCAVAAVIILQ